MLSKETPEEIIQFIRDFDIFRHGCPAKIQTNGGRPYVLEAIYYFCQSFSLQHKVTAAYHPHSNQKAERVIQTLKSCIRKLQVALREEWVGYCNWLLVVV